MNRSAFVGSLALGFVVLAGAHAADASGGIFAPGPIGGPWIEQPPIAVPRDRDLIETASLHGKVQLRPAGVDVRWCSSLKVTAKVQKVEIFPDCADYGGIYFCRNTEIVVDEYSTESWATPVSASHRVWEYQMSIATYEETRVKLSAQCAPAYDYRYRSRGAGAKKFAIAGGDTRKRNLRLQVSVPKSETRTVVIEPSIVEGTWESRCQPGFPEFSCDPIESEGETVDGEPYVGYQSFENVTAHQAVYQALLWFDLSEIESVARKLVLSAELRYREQISFHRGIEEPITFALSCIGGVGRATEDWTAGLSGLVANDEIGSARGPWSVARDVSGWLAYPETNYGFVIKGTDEGFTPADSRACVSYIQKPELVVTFLAIPDVPVVF